MTVDEAKHKMDFLKKAYQKLLDEKVDSGKLVGDGVMGEWKAETSLDEAYKDMIEALEIAIKALEQQPCEDVLDKIKAEIIEKFDNCSICEWFENYDYDENDISEYMSVGHILDIIDIIDKYRKGGMRK